jgi:hypothetical protein
MDDASISSMFDDAMKAIQESSQPAEPVAEPVSALPASEPLATPEPTPVVEAPASVEQPPVETNRSVADILGSMGMSVPGADETEAAFSSPEPTPVSAPTPVAAAIPEPEPAVSQSVPAAPVFANMNNETESAGTQGNGASAGGDDDIQAYMNRLLNRTQPTAQQAAAEQAVAEPQEEIVLTQETPQVLSAEEFKPTHKAIRPENYDTLREIANTSSRTAIRQSTKRANKQSFLLKVAGSVASLIGAGVTFWLGMTVPAGVLAVVSVLCAILCVLKK